MSAEPLPAPGENSRRRPRPASERSGVGVGDGTDGVPAAYILTRAAAREIDRLASEEYGIPSIVLMENAAIHLSEIALHLLRETDSPRALIMCGPGNNGGDGLALARHLHNASVKVGIVLGAGMASYRGDAAINLDIVRRMGLDLTTVEEDRATTAVERSIERLGPPHLVVDALLGTGARDSVRGAVQDLIHEINRLKEDGPTVLAVDVPSGLDCDTGAPLGQAVRADFTVTFCGLKAGFLTLEAQEFIGDVMVVDIGAPRELTTRLGRPLEQDAHPDETPPPRPARPKRPDRPPRTGARD